jgi:mono/diheme cytochrome c family protein
LSCHAIEGRGATYAPDLTGEGSRLHEQWIAQFVESPDIVRPLSQQMPKLNLTAEEARIIASALSTSHRDARIPENIPGEAVTAEDIQRGREAFGARGCFSCHTAGEGPGGVVGPDLRIIQDRMKPGAIWFHIRNPHAVNPYSTEPDYGLTDDEARVLAAYLSAGKQ